MRIRNKKSVISLILAVCISIIPHISSYAASVPDADEDMSIRISLVSSDEAKRPAEGAEVTLYRFADLKVTGTSYEYVLTEDFKGLPADLENGFDKRSAGIVADFADDNGIKGISYYPDATGLINVNGLKGGLYLARQTVTPDMFTSFDPFIITLPYYSEGTWVYDAYAEPKFSYLPPADINVTKVWNDDGSSRPLSVKVALSDEDGIVDTVELNEANNWKYTWKDMDKTRNWSVTEVEIPSGYTVTYSQKDLDFTVTNTAKLVQTGQLNMPVPVMLFAGLFLVSAGIIVRIYEGKRKQQK